MNIVWTDYREKAELEVPATPPVPWRRELNLPPQEWFRGEWLPARIQREAAESWIENENGMARKVLKLAAYLITGTLFVGGSLGAYLLMLALIGTP